MRFHPDFIKTGGGEDIAMCLDTVRYCGKPLLAAPKARALHPWWGEHIDPKRFFNWTQGDGLLQYKYPHYTYLNYPNVIECSLFAFFFASVRLQRIKSEYGILWLLWIWVIEGAFDIHHYLFADTAIAADRQGLSRVLCSLDATLIKAYVEIGHAWVHLKRGRFDMLFRRFDWWCGLNQNAIEEERFKALIRFIFFIFPPCMLGVYSYL
jgi:hypothetical protein